MTYTPDPERELKLAVRQARLVALTCGFLAPVMYLFSLGTQALGGRWGLFLTGFGRLPWADRRVPALLVTALLALALSVLLPPRLGRMDSPRAALGTLKLRNLVTSGLLAATAMCGLYLGIKLGPPAASSTLVLCLAAMIRCAFILPSEARWRAQLSRLT